MKTLVALLIFSLLPLLNEAQIINQVGNGIKSSTTTKAADYNRTRSNKEHSINNSSPIPHTGETPVETPRESSEDANPEGETNPSGGSLRVDFSAEYVFTTKLTFQMLTYAENQVSDTKVMNYIFNDSVFMFNSEGGNMINDFKLNKMFMLDDASKVGIASPLISPEIMKLTYQTGLINLNFIKTGRTKMIAGFTCSEYTYTDPQTKKIAIWTSTENPLKDQNELIKSNIELFFMTLGAFSPEVGSMTLGIDQINENGQIESSLIFDTLSTEENRINLGEYQITSY